MVVHAGQVSKGGYYLNLGTGEVEDIARSGGILPGAGTATYLRIPAPLMFIVGPLEGLAYVILLLPFMAGTLLYLVFRRAMQNLKPA